MGKKKIFFIILGIIALNVYILIMLVWKKPGSKFRVVFFDVGQGDASLITAENGLQVLVDGGPDKRVVEKLDKYMPVLDKKIHIVILTHPHSDHVMGLVDVLQKYEVQEIWMTGVVHTSPEYLEFLKRVRDKKIRTKIIDHREKYKLARETYLETLYPVENLAGKKVGNLNDTSIVFMLTHNKKSFLFAGDIEKEGEKKLLKEEVDLRANVLKIAHHGSDNTSSEKFLKAVKPDAAVISVARENQFGMPSLLILRRLGILGAKIHRTDEEGDIIVSMEEENLKVKNEK